MEKNIAEQQLNKAYEAFRQVCVEKDSAVKELKQKTDSYEKQIRDQQEQIAFLTNMVTKLNSQLTPLSAANRVHTHDPVPVLEDSEARRNGTLINLNVDQLHEKLKSALQREKHLKEQLQNESVKLKQAEEASNLKEKKYESIIAIKEDEIRHLKEINEVLNCLPVPSYEKEGRSEEPALPRQELSPGAFAAATLGRDKLETVFWGLKEEFHRIRTLARAQTDQLSKFDLRREPVTEIPFSKPIQCTDEQADDLGPPWVKKGPARDVSHFPSIAPRGIGADEEENSVESLSKLNVKFPPTDHDSAFLQSTPEPVPCSVLTGHVLQNPHLGRELGDQAVTFGEATCDLFDERGMDSAASAVHNLSPASKTKPSAHTNVLVQSPLDKAPCFTPPYDLYDFGTTMFPKQDVPERNVPSSEANERTVGAPQQPLWNPHLTQDQDKDLLALIPSADAELDQPAICEFCQKVFPPSLTSREDFLRHLNSHFNLKS